MWVQQLSYGGTLLSARGATIKVRDWRCSALWHSACTCIKNKRTTLINCIAEPWQPFSLQSSKSDKTFVRTLQLFLQTHLLILLITGLRVLVGMCNLTLFLTSHAGKKKKNSSVLTGILPYPKRIFWNCLHWYLDWNCQSKAYLGC